MTSAAANSSYSALGAAAALPGKMAPSISVVPDATRRGDTKERMKAAAQDYEAVFVSTMLSQMFSGVKTSAPFGGGSAEETWRGLLINEYGKEISKSGGIGLADHIYRDLLRVQETNTQ
jgi:Rod binding domain-containing protein